MDLQIKSRGFHKVALTGNLMTGDTYPVSDWIKKYLHGKWDASRKGWIVDLAMVEKYTRPNTNVLMVI